MIVRRILSSASRGATISTSAIGPQKEIIDASEDITYEAEQRIVDEQRMMQLRNKSRLQPHHRAIERGVQCEVQNLPYFKTVGFRRRLFAKFGENSGVNPGIAWPTKEELSGIKDYLSLYEEASAKELIEQAWKRHEEKKTAAIEADRKVQAKMANREKDIDNYIAQQKKKNELARKAVEDKERLMSEVREHFGYNIDPRSEEVVAMLDERAKEQKKLVKEAKKKAKFEKAVSVSASKAKPADDESEESAEAGEPAGNKMK